MDAGGGNVHFNSLNLNRVDTASGVFIGNNVANGWRSSSKSNEGFGRASGCHISKTINIVFDNDEIDTVINDYQEESQVELALSTPQPQTINFRTLNVNAMSTNSAINMGENLLSGWRSHNKSNMGFGEGTGFNILVDNTNIIDDQDVVDSQIRDFEVLKNDQGNK